MPQDQKEGIGSRKGPRVGVLGGAIPAHISGLLWTHIEQQQHSSGDGYHKRLTISDGCPERTLTSDSYRGVSAWT